MQVINYEGMQGCKYASMHACKYKGIKYIVCKQASMRDMNYYNLGNLNVLK